MCLRVMGSSESDAQGRSPWSLQSREAIICPDTKLLEVTGHTVVLATMASLVF